MQVAQVGIEVRLPDGAVHLVVQKGVEQRQHRVDRIGGRPPHPFAEALIAIEALVEDRKVQGAALSLVAAQFVDAGAAVKPGDDVAQRFGLSGEPAVWALAVEAQQHSCLVGEFSGHYRPGNAQGKLRIFGQCELAFAQDDVFGLRLVEAAQVAAVPREEHRVGAVAEERVAGGRRQADVAAQDELIHLVQEDGAVGVFAAAHQQMAAFLDDAGSLRGDVDAHGCSSLRSRFAFSRPDCSGCRTARTSAATLQKSGGGAGAALSPALPGTLSGSCPGMPPRRASGFFPAGYGRKKGEKPCGKNFAAGALVRPFLPSNVVQNVSVKT